VSQGPGELAVFGTASNAVSSTVKVGKLPHWVAASGDSRTAFVTNEGSNDVSIVDLATGGVSSVPVGNAPRRSPCSRAARIASMGAPKAPAEVKILGFAFTPATTTISAGQTVTWINDERCAPRNRSERRRRLAQFAPGERMSMSFDKPGSYDYLWLPSTRTWTGRVIVQ